MEHKYRLSVDGFCIFEFSKPYRMKEHEKSMIYLDFAKRNDISWHGVEVCNIDDYEGERL